MTTITQPGGDPYVIVRGGLVTNDPAVPAIDLDVLDSDAPSDYDAEYARERASLARDLGLDEIADELDKFAADIEGADHAR